MNPENPIKTREHMHVRAGALATRVIREAPLTLSAEEIPRLFAIEANDIALLLITRVSAKEPYVEGKGVLSAASVAGFNPGYGGDDPGYLHFGPAARVNGPIPYVHFQVYNLDHRVEHTIFCSIAMYSNEAVTFSMGRPVMWSGDITIPAGTLASAIRHRSRGELCAGAGWNLHRTGQQRAGCRRQLGLLLLGNLFAAISGRQIAKVRPANLDEVLRKVCEIFN